VHHPIQDRDLHAALNLAAWSLRRAERVTVLTGAGVSAESGLATFRGAGGLWEGHRVEEVATPEAFQRDPTLVWRFYNLRRANLRTVAPNPGHHALAEMERRWGSDRFTLITQNVDGLHQAAGSKQVLEVHGSLSRVRCTECGQEEDRPGEALPHLPRCPSCNGMLRPGVVWFHETLPYGVWRAAQQASVACHCFLVVGTSALVYPAAGLIQIAKVAGASVIEVNLEPAAAGTLIDVGLHGPAGELLPELLRRLDAGPGGTA
jgi:NAD-dependent deacetylase